MNTPILTALQRLEVNMHLKGTVAAFFISQSSWLLISIVAYSPLLSDPFVMLGAGSVFIPSIAILYYKLLPPVYKDNRGKTRRRNRLYYMFCVFSWSCTIDMILVLEAAGVITGFMDYYLRAGEPYLGSPFGIVIDFWDATMHFLLYLMIIYKYDNDQNVRPVGLYWCGSMLTGMFCLLVGAAAGSYGTHTGPAIFLNIPYTVLPVCSLVYFLNMKTGKEKEKQNISTQRSILDVVLFLGLAFSILFGVLRGLAALDSPLPFVQAYVANYEPYIFEPGKFGAMHCLFTFMYGVPLQVLGLYGLYQGNAPWLNDLSLLYAGGVSQGTFYHIGAALLHTREPKYSLGGNMGWTVALNLMLPIIAHLLLYRSSVNKGTGKKYQ